LFKNAYIGFLSTETKARASKIEPNGTVLREE